MADGLEVTLSTAPSPSARREWIEMATVSLSFEEYLSPSARREWIEINSYKKRRIFQSVSLREEGVD